MFIKIPLWYNDFRRDYLRGGLKWCFVPENSNCDDVAITGNGAKYSYLACLSKMTKNQKQCPKQDLQGRIPGFTTKGNQFSIKMY